MSDRRTVDMVLEDLKGLNEAQGHAYAQKAHQAYEEVLKKLVSVGLLKRKRHNEIGKHVGSGEKWSGQLEVKDHTPNVPSKKEGLAEFGFLSDPVETFVDFMTDVKSESYVWGLVKPILMKHLGKPTSQDRTPEFSATWKITP